jgi:hypothetical protein
MRKLFLLAALSLSLTAFAQADSRSEPKTPDANNPEANNKAEVLDPATKARVRTEGSAGGTGARIPEEANGGASAGSGRQNRHGVTNYERADHDAVQGERRDAREATR